VRPTLSTRKSTDFTRISALYNAPAEYDVSGKIKLVLAEALTPNMDAATAT
jgi:hypothetical protein